MSVYTHLSENEVEDFLGLYDQGTLVSWKGIEAGVENSNYFVNTTIPETAEHKRFVLTIFEYMSDQQLPFFMAFMELLASSGLPVPAPVKDRSGKDLHQLHNKPCLLQPCLPGSHLQHSTITTDICAQIGKQLASIHVAAKNAPFHQENVRGLHWINLQVERLSPLLSTEDSELLNTHWPDISNGLQSIPELPSGLIHADLFVDNVLFENSQVTGIIDFFQSCHDWLLYDVAVTVNDWCLAPEKTLIPERTRALLKAYNNVRPFTKAEHAAWPLMLRLACLRFWISRLVTFVHPEDQLDHYQTEGAIRSFKDPDEFKEMLLQRTLSSFNQLLP